MFTGIIEKQGKVLRIEPCGESLKVEVASTYVGLELGESVAVDGVCLTVAELSQDGKALFFISPETIKRSRFASIRVGHSLNLERSLTLQKGLSGHFLQAHVDGKAKLVKVEEGSQCYSLYFEVPAELSRYCVEKGCVGLNGISLTIHALTDDLDKKVTQIGVTIIPHTWEHTNLSTLSVGDEVNLEVDILAKYVERLCHQH